MSRLFEKGVIYQENGPLMQELAKPQLMLVKHKSSTFMRNKKHNEEINREFMKKWRAKNPQNK